MVHLQAGDFAGARSDFEQIVQVAVQISDRGLEGAMLTLRGMTEHFQHDFAASERTLRAALAIGEDGFPGARFGAAMWLGGIYLMLDRHAEAAPLLSEAERLAPTVEDPFHQAWWGIISGSASIWRGRFTEALAALERWRVAAGARHQALLSLWTPWLEAMACGGAGKYQRAIICLDDAIASAKRVGEPMIVARALNTVGWIHGELGDPERALSWNERGVEAARQLAVPSPEILSNALLNVADNLRDLGRLDEAEQVLRSVEGIIDDARRQDPYLLWRYSLHFLSSSAELALVRGDHGRALDLADRCRRAAEDSGSLKYRVKAARVGGRTLAPGSTTVRPPRQPGRMHRGPLPRPRSTGLGRTGAVRGVFATCGAKRRDRSAHGDRSELGCCSGARELVWWSSWLRTTPQKEPVQRDRSGPRPMSPQVETLDSWRAPARRLSGT